jgi:signal transduction histidine kinase
VLRSFGRRVAIAVGYARARDQVEQLAVRLDRERIARDLHDTVIQRLFGAGLRLDGLTRQLADEPQRDAVEGVITELDAAIADLRATISSMHDPGPLPLEDQLRAVVAAMQPITVGLQPLQISGDPSRVPATLTNDMVAVLREGVTNATRHAEATRITPRLEVADGHAALAVVDDGLGPGGDGSTGRGHGLGLGNLMARAQRHGGACTLDAGPGGGAQLRWWVPLEEG